MIFEKILSTKFPRNVWRAVWRICMWISGLNGLILTLYATSFPVERKVSRTEWLIEISNSKNMLSRRLARNSATCKGKKYHRTQLFSFVFFLWKEEGLQRPMQLCHLWSCVLIYQYQDDQDSTIYKTCLLRMKWIFQVVDLFLYLSQFRSWKRSS